ncbi:MAG: glycosyltransferase [Candidatus Omnitrophota bacterium]
MKADIVVLNYNGKELLKECLPSMVEASKRSSQDCGVTVLDNNSTDGSIGLLREEFPDIRIYSAKENKVLCSYNEIAEVSDAEILIFMNNDIKVDADFVKPLLKHFDDKDVFYVAPKVLNFDDTFNGGKSYLRMRYGIIKVEIDKNTYDEEGTTHTIACGAFRRKMFLDLGGYDSIYLPGYWEDTDLCYRGLMSGLKGVYEPRARIYHKEHASFSKKFSWYQKMSIVDRNSFIFTWKNITDPILWCEHILFLIPRLFFSLISGRSHFALGFLKAMGKIPEIYRRRLNDEDSYTVKDNELISHNGAG